MPKFQPGQSGNPKGRPVGAKQKLSEDFLTALCNDFEAHGEAAIVKVREEKPDAYLRVIADLVPKDANLTVEHRYVALLPEQSTTTDEWLKQTAPQTIQ